MKRRTKAGSITAALAITLACAVWAGSAQAEPATPMSYSAGAAATRFTGLAFDTCEAPSRSQLQAWRSSPYGALGIYISGNHRACPQRELTPGWVRDVSAMGWRLLPLDVGLQAPCADNRRLRPMSTDPGQAIAQGAAAAAGAVQAAGRLGLLPGSALYSDVESYNGGDAPCAEAVRAYWSGWTRALHDNGYIAGVYGSMTSAVKGLTASHFSTAYARPDVVWTAQWNNASTLRGWSAVPDVYWSEHQRVKQFRGDGHETYGGVTLYTDRNIADAPVATVARSYQVAGTIDVPARVHPRATAAVARSFAVGTTAAVVCRTATDTGGWNKLAAGGYLPDAALGGGPEKDRLPTCAVPHQITAPAVFVRAGPAKSTQVVGTMTGGALAWITCETPGAVRGRPGFWHRLDNGGWVSGAFVATRLPGVRSAVLPLCV